MFAMLGDIPLGNELAAGPVDANEVDESEYVKIKPVRGKPIPHYMGEELLTKTMNFVWNEAWCDPNEQLDKLRAAKRERIPLAYVGGDGSFQGVRYLVERIEVLTLKTTPGGTPTYMEVSAELFEFPTEDLLGLFQSLARAQAPAIAGGSSFGGVK